MNGPLPAVTVAVSDTGVLWHAVIDVGVVTAGLGLTVTSEVAVFEQPNASVTVTVYG